MILVFIFINNMKYLDNDCYMSFQLFQHVTKNTQFDPLPKPPNMLILPTKIKTNGFIQTL